MADYVIINASGAELTDVNAGGDDVAAGTISADLTLDNTELAAVCALDNVAVMNAGASAAEKLAVGTLLVPAGASTTSTKQASPTTGLTTTSALDAIALKVALDAGAVLAAASLSDELLRRGTETLRQGTMPSKKTS